MGQSLSAPKPNKNIEPFINLPKQVIDSIWTSYCLHGRSWALNSEQFEVIFRNADLQKDGFSYSYTEMVNVFECFDTDANNLIDALEIFIALALVSGMDTEEKINFTFVAFDVRCSGTLSLDESALLLQTVVKGLGKISHSYFIDSLYVEDIMNYANSLFSDVNSNHPETQPVTRITYKEFLRFCSTHPVISAWLYSVSSFSGQNTIDEIKKEKKYRRPYSPLKVNGSRNPRLNNTTISTEEEQEMKENLALLEASSSPRKSPMKPTEPSKDEEDTEEVTDDKEDNTDDPDKNQINSTKQQESISGNLHLVEIPSWAKKVDLMMPEELPEGPFRTDPPEDVFEPVWISGLNTRVCCSDGSKRLMHRGAWYTSDELPPVPVEEDPDAAEEDAPPPPVPEVLYTASMHLVKSRKSGELGWQQTMFTEHSAPITCMCVNYATGTVVTASDEGLAGGKVVARAISTGIVLFAFTTAFGVQHLDISPDGKMLLLAFSDISSTLSLYELSFSSKKKSVTLAFSQHLRSSYLTTTDFITDVIFSNSHSMFVVASSNKGLRFFLDEGAGTMGCDGMTGYSERESLYHEVGKPAVGTMITELCRFERSDEIIAGTEKGQLMFWQGRNCVQLLTAHTDAVQAITYNSHTHTLASGSADGSVNLYQITKAANKRPTSAVSAALRRKNRGPVMVATRMLEVTETFNIRRHSLLLSFHIVSLQLYVDGKKILATTAGGELVELSLVLATTEPDPDAEAEEEDEPAVESKEVENISQLGDMLHGGPIVSSHSGPLEHGGDGCINALCLIPGSEGFISGGTDGLVRVWRNGTQLEEGTGSGYTVENRVKLGSKITNMDASSSLLAVSQGKQLGSNTDKLGVVTIFSLPDLMVVTELKEAEGCEITNLKFSGEGTVLLIASAERGMQLFQQIDDQWSIKGLPLLTNPKDTSQSEDVNKVDFSADGKFLKATYSPSNDLRIWDLGEEGFGTDLLNPTSGTTESTAASFEALRAATWTSNHCPHSWDTKGALSLQIPSLPACDTASPSALKVVATDRSRHLLLSALNNGRVVVDRIPVLDFSHNGLKSVEQLVSFPAHWRGVKAMMFIEDGQKLITAGEDGIICAWVVKYDESEFEVEVMEEEPELTEQVEDEEEEGEESELRGREKFYDSAEDEDIVLDLDRMKEHLSVRNKKRYKKVLSTVGATEDTNKPEEYVEEPPNLYSGLGEWPLNLGIKQNADLSQIAKTVLAAPPSFVPTDELELDWLYGSSCRSTRNSVRYTSEGAIVYPAGTVAVLYDKLTHTQKYCQTHSDEITALDVHLGLQLGVTATKGTGKIYASIWNTKDGLVIRTLDCGEVNGVSALQFSPDGSHITVACQDKYHSVLMFRVSDGHIMGKCLGGLKKILSLSFSLASSLNSQRILQAGIAHFRVISFFPGQARMIGKTGSYGADVRKNNVLCAAALPMQTPAEGEEVSGNEFVLGLADGSMGFVAAGETAVAGFNPVFKGAVTALCVVKLTEGSEEEAPTYKIVAGGVNGQLKVLDSELSPLAEFNLYKKEYGLQPLGRVRGFKSLCVDRQNRKILYGTAGGEIGEIDIETGADMNENNPLVVSHFRDQLHSLCSHPLEQECLTAGDDKTLRLWSLTEKSVTLTLVLPDVARTGTYSPDGSIIVLGLGGEVAGTNRVRPFVGSVLVISRSEEELKIINTLKEATHAITCVLFSPDGSRLFVGCKDGRIFVHNPKQDFAKISVLQQHKETVRAFDMPNDGSYLISMSSSSELLLWDMKDFSFVDEPSVRLRILTDIGFDYYVKQGPLGLNSVGIFPEYSDPSDVLTLTQSADNKLIVSGDCFGDLKLFRNPATEFFAPCKKYALHSPGGISKVTFSPSDKFLLSIGRSDRILAQWRVVKSPDLPESSTVLDIEKKPLKRKATSKIRDDFFSSFTVIGVDLTALQENFGFKSPMKARLRGIVGIGSGGLNSALPDEINPTHGRWGLPCAKFCGHGEIFTTAGKLPMVLDGIKAAQYPIWAPCEDASIKGVYNNPKQQEVSVFSVSYCGRFVAVGYSKSMNTWREDLGGRLTIHTAPLGFVVTELSENVEGGVSTVRFSDSGAYVACVAADKQHSLSVYRTFTGDWDDATLIAHCQVTLANINLLAFLSRPAVDLGAMVPQGTSFPEQFDFVTGGEAQLRFWKIKGLNVHSTCVEYGKDLEKPLITALVSGRGGTNSSYQGNLISGDAAGHVYLWRGKKRDVLMGRHQGPVTALHSFVISSIGTRRSQRVPGFISASNDVIMIYRSKSTTEVPTLHQTISLDSVLHTNESGVSLDTIQRQEYVTSIDTDASCQRLLLSFKTGLLVTVSPGSGDVQKKTERHGHVKVLCSHPSDPSVVFTVGRDGVLRAWDISRETIGAGQGGSKRGEVIDSTFLCGALGLKKPITTLTFMTDSVLLVASGDSPSESSIITVINSSIELSETGEKLVHLTVIGGIVNRGKGPVYQLQVSPIRAFPTPQESGKGDTTYNYIDIKYLAVCCHDGLVYIYDVVEGISVEDDFKEFPYVGFLYANTSGKPVGALDFSTDGRFVRTFGLCDTSKDEQVEVNFFDFELAIIDGSNPVFEHAGEPAAGRITAPTVLKNLARKFQWDSFSSPAAPEVLGLSYFGPEPVDSPALPPRMHVSSISVSSNKKLICAGYQDGSAAIFRFPLLSAKIETNPESCIRLDLHSNGPVLCSFSPVPVSQDPSRESKEFSYRLCTVGEIDGALMVWHITHPSK